MPLILFPGWIDMELIPSETNVVDVYHALTSVVTPRPIAWVTTLSANGVVNLAPFSFFNVFGANPPVIVFSPTLKRDCTKKDTLINLEAQRECVVHTSVAKYAEAINHSSKELPPDQSEVDLIGLKTVPSYVVRTPRLADVPVAMECVVQQIIATGTGPIAGNLVICHVVAIHINDDLLDENQRPDPRKLQSIARLGSDYWCHTSELFQLPRP
jgi:flavin reductase (DIM6/NTAB) family NADH-FMN oxidoreductase RutF